ncbi:uncharacterized protein LY89DRAFT_682720 [Mollisia scopiformis]|uniref:Uncharacterized protein n=1 Tax=Mollisia scopiformis TaxID=149040 RepID=A0A194XI95_MOLSC|nr:uncharacterized protein LY89DRAFT_682720 [Mollisia scopiformis]KUJ19883.1 hypothetical protein LY89DRAFT_682720 [Mollisia scopiformis]
MTKFSTNCTLPPDIINYVTQPNTRGTVDILLTCLTTIVLCTWSIQHPNVPAYIQNRGWRDYVKRTLTQFKLMIFSIFAPEFLLLTAFGDLSCAIALTKQFGSVAEKDGVEWSLVHSFFINMGGFVILFSEETPKAPLPQVKPQIPAGSSGSYKLESQISKATTSESILSATETNNEDDLENALPKSTAVAVATPKESKASKESKAPPKKPKQPPNKRVAHILSVADRRCKPKTDKNSLLVEEIIADLKQQFYSGDDINIIPADLADILYNLIRLRGTHWALDGPQLLLARELGIVKKIPGITSDEIDDIAKGDLLAKILAIVHVTWQIVQLIMRKAESLPSSQFEVVTVAFSVCAFCTYLLYWNKPQNIAAPRFVKADRCPTKEEVLELARAGPAYVAGVFPGDDYSMPGHALHSDLKGARQKFEGGILGWAGGILGGMLFGLLHCAAWDYHFPTPVEGLLWRIAAVVTAAWPLIYGARALVVSPVENDGQSRKNGLRRKVLGYMGPVTRVLGFGIAFVYVLARLYLLVGTFRSLFFLLPATFKNS